MKKLVVLSGVDIAKIQSPYPIRGWDDAADVSATGWHGVASVSALRRHRIVGHPHVGQVLGLTSIRTPVSHIVKYNYKEC